jgi:hypothetical protein
MNFPTKPRSKILNMPLDWLALNNVKDSLPSHEEDTIIFFDGKQWRKGFYTGDNFIVKAGLEIIPNVTHWFFAGDL